LTLGGVAATLSGTWDTDITIDPQEAAFNHAIYLHSIATVVYTVGDWSFTSTTGYNSISGWYTQGFNATGVLGAFSIASMVGFDPDVPQFVFWSVDMGVSIAGVSIAAAFYLLDEDVALGLGFSGTAGDIEVNVGIGFGTPGDDICDLDWRSLTLTLNMPFCCADVLMTVSFSCDGFDFVNFVAEDITIPTLPWLTIDLVLGFNLFQGKYIVIDPSFNFGEIACFDLYIEVDYSGAYMGPLNLDAIHIDGISLTCDIGAVTFTGISYWGPLIGANRPSLLADQDTYWEAYQIKTNDDACCGPFGFDLALYFDENGIRLFDIALIDANMTLQVASQFTFNMGLMIDVDGGAFTQWTLGFEVTW